MVNGREVALFADDIHVPLAPFMGIMAVAPDPVVGEPGVTVPGVQASRPPGLFGGNLDVKDLTAGSTLYLPVLQPDALFYVGDPHSAQGDGEVSGTAIEQSLTGTFRFVLHEDRELTAPRAETDTHYVLMGIDLDLDRALQKAVEEVVAFLAAEHGLSPDRALSLASIAVDFQVAEAVDLTQVVTGKSGFRRACSAGEQDPRVGRTCRLRACCGAACRAGRSPWCSNRCQRCSASQRSPHYRDIASGSV